MLSDLTTEGDEMKSNLWLSLHNRNDNKVMKEKNDNTEWDDDFNKKFEFRVIYRDNEKLGGLKNSEKKGG